MTGLLELVRTLPPDWKWFALFDAPAQHDAEWRAWLADAQRAEETALLRYWAENHQAAA